MKSTNMTKLLYVVKKHTCVLAPDRNSALISVDGGACLAQCMYSVGCPIEKSKVSTWDLRHCHKIVVDKVSSKPHPIAKYSINFRVARVYRSMIKCANIGHVTKTRMPRIQGACTWCGCSYSTPHVGGMFTYEFNAYL